MKRYTKIFISIVTIVFLPNSGIKGQTPKQGTYEPQVILSAPWGEKNLRMDSISSEPGEFGFYLDESGLEHGPTAFTIAPNGDIYIADNINNRVQRFSPTGSLLGTIPNVFISYAVGMRVDKEMNIYTGNFRTADPYVKKFDPQGNLLITYQIIKDEDMGTDKPYRWGGQGNILIDDSARVFIQYIRSGMVFSFQVGTKDVPFSTAQQKATWKEGFYGISANLPTGSKRYTANLLGVDNEAEYRIEKDMKNENISIITKYDLIGRLIGTYTLDWRRIECPLITAFSMSGNQVFDKGNIYVFCSTKKGITIIKWSPSTK
jgi:hypothetical protein